MSLCILQIYPAQYSIIKSFNPDRKLNAYITSNSIQFLLNRPGINNYQNIQSITAYSFLVILIYIDLFSQVNEREAILNTINATKDFLFNISLFIHTNDSSTSSNTSVHSLNSEELDIDIPEILTQDQMNEKSLNPMVSLVPDTLHPYKHYESIFQKYFNLEYTKDSINTKCPVQLYLPNEEYIYLLEEYTADIIELIIASNTSFDTVSLEHVHINDQAHTVIAHFFILYPDIFNDFITMDVALFLLDLDYMSIQADTLSETNINIVSLIKNFENESSLTKIHVRVNTLIFEQLGYTTSFMFTNYWLKILNFVIKELNLDFEFNNNVPVDITDQFIPIKCLIKELYKHVNQLESKLLLERINMILEPNDPNYTYKYYVFSAVINQLIFKFLISYQF